MEIERGEFKLNEMQMRCSKRSRRRRNPSISLSVLLLLCYTLHGRCLSQRMPSSLYRPPSSSVTGLFRPPLHSPSTPLSHPSGVQCPGGAGRRKKARDGRTDGGAPSPPPPSGRSPVIRQRTLLLHLASLPPPRPRASLLRQCGSPLPPTKVLCVFFPRSYGGEGSCYYTTHGGMRVK